MNALEGLMENVQIAEMETISNELKPIKDMAKTVANYTNKILTLFNEYKETGKLPSMESVETLEDCVPNSQNAIKRSSIKENIQPIEPESAPRTRGRPRRNALKETTQQSNEANSTVSMKLRRPTTNTDSLENIQIKTEKLSLCESVKAEEDVECLPNVKIKAEAEEMPAPTRPAPRKKKQEKLQIKQGKLQLQIKQEKLEESESIPRDSDVIVQNTTITMINLVDSSDEVDDTLVDKPEKRVTRTKGAQKKMKRTRTQSSEDEIRGSCEKKSKTSEKNKDAQDDTNHEDTITNLNSNKDATFISKTVNQVDTQQNLNATVVVDNPKLVKALVPETVEDMMTDDESEEEIKPKKLTKPIRAIPKPTKQIFSPFEQSPVKKKVQAFEKLKEDANAMPPRLTRTKTRAKAKEQQPEEETAEIESKETKTNTVKEKAKLFTPLSSKYLPLASSTGVKSKLLSNTSSNESLLSVKSVSALKASQAEYREREKKRREKEQDALKKRDALLQAKIEEQKRKREEKQLKAQQQREVLEKEKLKALEVQKLKDERHKQLMAEQEERKLKQKEEQERKRLMAKMKAIEEKQKLEEKKKKEEERKNEEERRAGLQKDKKVPIYMKMRAPLLPTDDCYDSDEDNCGNSTFVAPKWADSSNLKFMQKCASVAGEAIKNTFFSIQAQTPDLSDIFENIDVKKLKRTSSAIWHKAPRFSMIPGLESFAEETDE